MSFGERFLANPDLFPARVSGEAWGDLSIQIDIACGPFILTGLSDVQVEAVRKLYGEYCSKPGDDNDAALSIRVLRAYPNEVYDEPIKPLEYPIEIDLLPHAMHVAGYRFMALFNGRPFTECGIWLLRELEIGSRLVIENTLRIAVAYRLLERGGILLHSAGIVRNGKAYIFFGHSGAGKTTISRMGLASGANVLSDDLNALFLDDGQLFVEKMPFAGELGEVGGAHGNYPVSGIFFLQQGKPCALEPVSETRAIAKLFGSSPFVNADPRVTDRAMSNIEAIVSATTISGLTFALDEDFWPLLDTRPMPSAQGNALQAESTA